MKEYKDFLSTFYPVEFVDKLIESFSYKPYSSFWVNPNKKVKEGFLEGLERHPIVENGYYFDKDIKQFGKDIYHECGCYYIQEPSAMIVASLLEINENDKVIDLCAAPGGKSCYVGTKLKNGLLITNDISFKRSLDLLENIERMGIKNSIVTNEDATKLMTRFTGYFDKVILDAPCSGEGMFRKSQSMIDDWSIEKVKGLVDIQKELIIGAYKMLKYKGLMTYSTCTYNKLENEEVINYLLENTNAKLVMIPEYDGVERGIDIKEAIRLFPCNFKGEGHFICLIESNDNYEQNTKSFKNNIDNKSLDIFNAFAKQTLNYNFDKSRLYSSNNNLYYIPLNCPDLKNINVLKYGLYLGEVKDNYFIPSHHLGSALKVDEWKNTINFNKDSKEANDYINGQSFKVDSNIKGFAQVTIDNIPLGICKIVNGQLKNFYPKKLRR